VTQTSHPPVSTAPSPGEPALAALYRDFDSAQLVPLWTKIGDRPWL
jgi:hypothetical protein